MILDKGGRLLYACLLAACLSGCVSQQVRKEAPQRGTQSILEDAAKEKAGDMAWCYIFMNGC